MKAYCGLLTITRATQDVTQVLRPAADEEAVVKNLVIGTNGGAAWPTGAVLEMYHTNGNISVLMDTFTGPDVLEGREITLKYTDYLTFKLKDAAGTVYVAYDGQYVEVTG